MKFKTLIQTINKLTMLATDREQELEKLQARKDKLENRIEWQLDKVNATRDRLRYFQYKLEKEAS